MVDIYRAASRLGKYSQLATSTWVNNIIVIYYFKLRIKVWKWTWSSQYNEQPISGWKRTWKVKNSGLNAKPKLCQVRLSCEDRVHFITLLLKKQDHSSISVITRPTVTHTTCFVLKPQINNKLLVVKRSQQKMTGSMTWCTEYYLNSIIAFNYPLNLALNESMTSKVQLFCRLMYC